MKIKNVKAKLDNTEKDSKWRLESKKDETINHTIEYCTLWYKKDITVGTTC